MRFCNNDTSEIVATKNQIDWSRLRLVQKMGQHGLGNDNVCIEWRCGCCCVHGLIDSPLNKKSNTTSTLNEPGSEIVVTFRTVQQGSAAVAQMKLRRPKTSDQGFGTILDNDGDDQSVVIVFQVNEGGVLRGFGEDAKKAPRHQCLTKMA